MRILRYLSPHKVTVFGVLILLFLQAGISLVVPWCTAQIIDIGVQQAGVQRVTTDVMTSQTFHNLQRLLSEKDFETLEKSYSLEGGVYALTEFGRAHSDELDAILLDPLVLLRASDTKVVQVLKDNLAEGSSLSDSEEITSLYRDALASLDRSNEQLFVQKGIVAAQAELSSAGVDLNNRQITYVLQMGMVMLALAALEVMISVAIGYLAAQTGSKVAAHLRSQLFRKVVSFSDAEVQSFSAASLITRGTNDIQLIQMAVILSLRMMLYSPILAVGGIVMVSLTNLSMAWVVFCAVACVLILVVFLLKVAMPKFRTMQTLVDRVNLVSREMLTGLSVIRAFDRQDYEEKRFDVANTDLMKTQLFTNRTMTFMMPAMTLIMNVTSVAIVWVGGIYISNGIIQTGDLIAFITYSMVIIMSFLMLGMIAIILPRADVAATRVNEVLDASLSIQDTSNTKRKDDDLRRVAAAQMGARIVFDKVSFRYENSQEYVLDNVSFVAEAGKTTALIGSTGSGKSSVLKLIERFYDVESGFVSIDGIDVRDVSQSLLRKQIGYVPQQSFLFAGTVASNIEYSQDSPMSTRTTWALEQAQALDFVLDKEEGIQSEISQGGTNVSGGQRQRLSIARALASNARVFLFDDSFSALDYQTDARVRKALATELAGKTIIIVAQRIATVLQADLIVVLDEGRVVGQGTHEELLKSCTQYQEIAYSQLSSEELKGGEVHV